MNDHIAKPIEVEKLFEVLRRWAPAGGYAGPAGASRVASGSPAQSSAVVSAVREAAKTAVDAAVKAMPPTAPGTIKEAAAKTASGKTKEAAPPVPDITGVDAAGAVSRLAGNTRIYLKTVRLFLENIPRYRDEITAAVGEKDKERLRRGAHTLKGLTATIGAGDVSTAAAAVEKAQADDNAAPDPTGVDDLLALLGVLERNLAASGVGGDTAAYGSGTEAASPADVGPVLDKLKTLLREYDGSAVDCFAENRAALASRYPAGVCRELERLLRDFAYDEALELLETGSM
jgi:HPt (histidine-containing phosphotransfer) domain-containing protein